MATGFAANLQALQVTLYTPNSRGGWGAPTLFLGGPGVAKTMGIEAVGAPAGLPSLTLSPGHSGEGAFGVVPSTARRIADDGSTTTVLEYSIPAYLIDRFGGLKTGAGILFVDEVTSAPDHILPALLGLIGSGAIGFTRLPPRLRVFGAANPADIAADGRELPAPLANRFIRVPWHVPTANETVSYLTGAGALYDPSDSPVVQPAEVTEKRVLDAWTSAWARTVGIHAGFLRSQCAGDSNAAPMYDFPKDRAATFGAWASPRSWENGLRAITTARILGVDADVRSAFLAGAVGNGYADAWEAFEDAADLPPIEDVLDGRIPWTIDERRPDKAVAVIAGIHTILCGKDSKSDDPAYQARRRERANRVWEILDAAPASSLDLVAMASAPLSGADLANEKGGAPKGAARNVLRKLGRVINAG